MLFDLSPIDEAERGAVEAACQAHAAAIAASHAKDQPVDLVIGTRHYALAPGSRSPQLICFGWDPASDLLVSVDTIAPHRVRAAVGPFGEDIHRIVVEAGTSPMSDFCYHGLYAGTGALYRMITDMADPMYTRLERIGYDWLLDPSYRDSDAPPAPAAVVTLADWTEGAAPPRPDAIDALIRGDDAIQPAHAAAPRFRLALAALSESNLAYELERRRARHESALPPLAIYA